MSNFVTRFLKDESGATAIEYGLIAALIAAVLAGTLTTIGQSLNTKLQSVNTSINGTTP
jgi:pilus assembly protein Flp/PilA